MSDVPILVIGELSEENGTFPGIGRGELPKRNPGAGGRAVGAGQEPPWNDNAENPCAAAET